MNKLSKLKLSYLLPVLLWASIIFIFSASPTAKTSEVYWQDYVVKKLAHVLFYGILSLLLYRFYRNNGLSPQKAGYWSIFTSLLYGVSDEFHQSFTPGRDPTLRDVIFDTIGASLMIYYIWKLLPKAPKILKNWAEKLEVI